MLIAVVSLALMCSMTVSDFAFREVQGSASQADPNREVTPGEEQVPRPPAVAIEDDCDKWQLRGIRIGMTAEEIKGRIEMKLKKKGRSLCYEVQKGAAWDLLNLSTDVCVQFDQDPKAVPKARATSVIFRATGKNLSYDSLLASLKENWGNPETEDRLTQVPVLYYKKLGLRTAWLDKTCDKVAELVRWTDIEFISGTRIDIERYVVTLIRHSDAEAFAKQQRSGTSDVLFGEKKKP